MKDCNTCPKGKDCPCFVKDAKCFFEHSDDEASMPYKEG